MKTIEIIPTGVSGQNGGGILAHAPGAAGAAEKIERSIAFMASNLDRPLQVATLAARVNVSPSHYFALFKRQTGFAPIDYFIRLRMERARELLDATAVSVKEIAAMLGYNDPFYFSRAFKSVNRIAPTGYRARQRALREKDAAVPAVVRVVTLPSITRPRESSAMPVCASWPAGLDSAPHATPQYQFA
jgi:AraC-like DNA-binding protein